MKIYAARNDNLLDRFIGKDLWVLCNDLEWSDTYPRPIYVKVFSKHPSGYRVSMVPKRTVDDFYGCNVNTILDTLAGSRFIESTRLQIITPVEVKTTAEMLPESDQFADPYTEDKEYFRQFIGRDLWVKARNRIYGDYYIRILSMDDNTIVINEIDNSCVDSGVPSALWNSTELKESIIREYTDSIGDWTRTSDAQTYTTAEIYKRLGLGKP